MIFFASPQIYILVCARAQFLHRRGAEHAETNGENIVEIQLAAIVYIAESLNAARSVFLFECAAKKP